MELAHDTLVWLSKSFGLFYMLAMSAAVLVYTYWPSNKARFKRAATAIFEHEDRP